MDSDLEDPFGDSDDDVVMNFSELKLIDSCTNPNLPNNNLLCDQSNVERATTSSTPPIIINEPTSSRKSPLKHNIKLDSNEIGPGDIRLLQYFNIYMKNNVPITQSKFKNWNIQNFKETSTESDDNSNPSPFMNLQINSKKLLRIAQEQQIADPMSSEERKQEVCKSNFTSDLLISSIEDVDNEDEASSSLGQHSDSSSTGFQQGDMFRTQRIPHKDSSSWIQPDFPLSLDLNSDVDYNADSSSVAASVYDEMPIATHSATTLEVKPGNQSNNSNNSSNESSSNGNGQLQQRYLFSMLNRPSILGTIMRRRRKRLQKTNDYFSVSRNVNVYNLIRYSFSSKYAQKYLNMAKSRMEINNFIVNCKNFTSKIIPEEETVVRSKIFLVSSQSIKQAKRSNRKYKNPRWHRLLNQGVKFQSYLFSGSLKFLKNDLDSLDSVFESEKNSEQYPSLNDHDYIRQGQIYEDFDCLMNSLKKFLKQKESSSPNNRQLAKQLYKVSLIEFETELIQDFESSQITVSVPMKPVVPYSLDKLNNLVDKVGVGSERFHDVLSENFSHIRNNPIIVTPYYMWLCRYNTILKRHHKSINSLKLNDCLSVVAYLFRLSFKLAPNQFEQELYEFLIGYSQANFSKQLIQKQLKRYKSALRSSNKDLNKFDSFIESFLLK